MKDLSNPPPVDYWLNAVGLEAFCQWDVLVFLYRHPTSLLSGENIARMVGYPISAVMTAVDSLEPLGFLQRSRVAHGRRLYQLAMPSDPRRGEAFDKLLALTDNRAGRLLLRRALQRTNLPTKTRGRSSGKEASGGAS